MNKMKELAFKLMKAEEKTKEDGWDGIATTKKFPSHIFETAYKIAENLKELEGNDIYVITITQNAIYIGLEDDAADAYLDIRIDRSTVLNVAYMTQKDNENYDFTDMIAAIDAFNSLVNKFIVYRKQYRMGLIADGK